MTPIGLDNLQPNVAQTLSRVDAQQAGARFDRLVRRADAATVKETDDRQHKAREAAHDLVSTTFIMPMLAAMREDPFRSDLFHGGAAEDMFGARLDQIIADRVTRSARFPLVDAVYRQLSGAPHTELDTHG